MLRKIKYFLLSHEPFKPMHVGNWVRGQYLRKYFPRHVAPGALVLDAGCGNGRHSLAIHEMFPQTQIEGTDIKEFSDWKTFTNEKVSFYQSDVTKLNEPNKYDAVISIDMLEHIIDNRRVLVSFFHSLKLSGILYLAIPCEENERYILPKKWFGEFYKWADEEHIGEMRRLPELVAVMKEIGFEILLARYTFTFFGHLAWELEYILRGSRLGRRANLLFMPAYKLLGILDYYFPIGVGSNLVIAQKPRP